MKICFYSPSWPPEKSHNGIVTYLGNISSSDSLSNSFNIVSPKILGSFDGAYLCPPSNYNFLERAIFKTSSLFNSRILKSISKNILLKGDVNSLSLTICKIKPTLVEIEESFGYAFYLKKKINCPISTRLHGPWFLLQDLSDKDKFYSNNRIKYEGLAIRNSDFITAPSLDVLEKTREFYQLELKRSIVIPNPVKPVALEDRWIRSNSRSILFVGRFDLIKGGDILIRAFNLIAKKHDDLVLNFIGTDNGVIENGIKYNFYNYIKKEVLDAKIKCRINFLGFKDPKEILEFRKVATITVVPSRYETFSLALLEAMAVGSPVIASNVGGMKEIIDHDQNGLLFNNGSIDDLVSKMDFLLGNVEKADLYSTNAIQKSLIKYSPDVVAKQMLDYYSSYL